MAIPPQVIEVKAGEVAEELKRLGIGSDERVTVTITPEQEIVPGRREFARAGGCRRPDGRRHRPAREAGPEGS